VASIFAGASDPLPFLTRERLSLDVASNSTTRPVKTPSPRSGPLACLRKTYALSPHLEDDGVVFGDGFEGDRLEFRATSPPDPASPREHLRLVTAAT
jgi:hypothetical protein